MLLFKKSYLIQIFNQYLLNKMDDTVGLWIRIYLLELNYLFEGVKDVMTLDGKIRIHARLSNISCMRVYY